MKVYPIFHGELLPSEVGKKLREIVKTEKSSFKIMTGYGSTTGISKSKQIALTTLKNLQKEGLIAGYFPGEVKNQVLNSTSQYYLSKLKYESSIKRDSDYGNDGIIYIFIA